ncbi:prepilin-type N-terminal cleavage/methylation domain-containing protein [Bordetella genomosp. 5]|uniref:prepilin-type N-terminal cleavage/methylation domain-containing protein n=1 Tax=Bordetella genomosp. 5 TaxID=1395608 RepID=UPI00113FC9F1|nr:prepilin-type N-terminal cleavage/methylation domain-containing protein [Bordetella genomosp. 5]
MSAYLLLRVPCRLGPHRALNPRIALRRQRGMSLVEISIVASILLLVAVFGIPAVRGYVIEFRVPRVGEEVHRFVARMQGQAWSNDALPYTNMGNATLARAFEGSSIVITEGADGAAPTLRHGLGQTGRITAVPAAAAGGVVGSAYRLAFDAVHDAACPGLAAVLQQAASVVTLQGRGGAVTVKDDTRNPPLPYDGLQALAECARGESNRFEFTFR